MSRPEWSPEEFARVVALPAEHPERRAAERDPGFVAQLRMLESFEAGSAPVLGPAELDQARERLQKALAQELPLGRSATRKATGEERRAEAPRRSWFDALLAPGGRVALGFAALAIASGAAWWALAGHGPDAGFRGGAERFHLVQSSAPAGAIELSWPAGERFDGYTLRFLDESLQEIARVDVGAATRYELHPGQLPDGLKSGQHVLVEVVGRLNGDDIAPSNTQSLTLP